MSPTGICDECEENRVVEQCDWCDKDICDECYANDKHECNEREDD